MRTLMLALMAGFAVEAAAFESVTPLDLVFSGPDLVGQEVTVEGCHWYQANSRTLQCDVKVDDATIATITAEIFHTVLPVYRDMIVTCSGSETPPACSFPIVGFVKEVGPAPRLDRINTGFTRE
ncbi:MAG: hypothetical protein JJ902_05305 [Roseibium sp.]|nr:hypothetical protein [Roseibium sp.]